MKPELKLALQNLVDRNGGKDRPNDLAVLGNIILALDEPTPAPAVAPAPAADQPTQAS